MRILLVTADPITSAPIGGGFQHRYWALATALVQAGHDIRILGIDRWDGADWTLPSPGLEAAIVPGPPKLQGIHRLLKSLLDVARPRRKTALGSVLTKYARDWGTDLAVGLTPFNPELLRGFAPGCPLVFFAEEDFAQSWDAQASHFIFKGWLNHLDRWIARRTWPNPAHVVVISERERAWAERAYPGALVKLVNGFLDESNWALGSDRGQACDVLAVGEFSDARNARGLRSFLDALHREFGAGAPLVHIASRHPLHECLTSALNTRVVSLGFIPQAGALYASARVCIVPAFAVSGAKNQVLQGWFLGCPVVGTNAAGISVEGSSGVNLLTGDTAAELAQSIRHLLENETTARRLADAGRRQFDHHHRESDVAQDFVEWLEGRQ